MAINVSQFLLSCLLFPDAKKMPRKNKGHAPNIYPEKANKGESNS